MPPEFRLTDAEREAGVLFVKSDVYPVGGEVFLWEAHHPSGWYATGTGSSHRDCVDQINRLLAEELAKSSEKMTLSDGIAVMREFHGDTLTGVDVVVDDLRDRPERT